MATIQEPRTEEPRGTPASQTRRGQLRAAHLTHYLLLSPAIVLFLVFIAYPLGNTLRLSLYNARLSSSTSEFVGLDNFKELIGDPVFWTSITNNVIILVGSVVFQVGLGIILAAVFHRGVGKRFSAVGRTIVFIPMVMSAAAVGLLWALIFNPSIGAIDTLFNFLHIPTPEQGWLGDPSLAIFAVLFVACWQYTGFMMVILFAGMQAIPVEIYEAAALDGASEATILRRITLPGIRNVVIAAVLITVIGSFKAFDTVYVLTNGGPSHASEVLGTYLYKEAFNLNRMGYASSIAVVLLIFTMAFSIIQLRVQNQSEKPTTVRRKR